MSDKAKDLIKRDTRPVLGHMVLKVYDDGDGHLAPEVEFVVLGRLNEQRLELLQPYIYQQLRIKRAAERHKEKQNG